MKAFCQCIKDLFILGCLLIFFPFEQANARRLCESLNLSHPNENYISERNEFLRPTRAIHKINIVLLARNIKTYMSTSLEILLIENLVANLIEI